MECYHEAAGARLQYHYIMAGAILQDRSHTTLHQS
jgi:hypothetical protein